MSLPYLSDKHQHSRQNESVNFKNSPSKLHNDEIIDVINSKDGIN